MFKKNDHAGKDFFIGAMIGSTLGALTAAMFGTKKGHKFQKDMADKYHDFEGMLKGYVNGKKRQVKREYKKITEMATKKVRKVKRKVRVAKVKAKRKVRKVKRAIKS
jgi:gas vesicle protein